jgi:hypothetical protein
MSILNRESDGIHPVLLTLARAVAREKVISREDLISICFPLSSFVAENNRENEKDKDPSSRARATLTRWLSLELFAEDGNQIRLNVDLARGESPDALSERLPAICRSLALHQKHGLPLWSIEPGVTEEGAGRTADLCRGLAWCLAQDIYALPNTHAEIEDLVNTQVLPERFVFLNDTRWPALRAWASFLGFATGDGSGFFCDPSAAVRCELKEIIHKKESVPAAEFVSRLAARLPVLDSGTYRREVEQALKPGTWKAPAPGHLSTALSFALRRFHKQGILGLITLADAGSRLALTGQGGRTWETFTHVRLLKDA